MAGTRIIFPQFRDEQSDSRYPFIDTATLRTGNLEIGRTAIVDAVLYPIGGIARAYISTIEVTTQTVTIWIGAQNNNKICKAEFSAVSSGVLEDLPLVDNYNRPAGLLLVDGIEIAKLAGWPQGSHVFRATTTEFVSSVVIPAQEPGVRAVLPATDELMTDDIWLVGDQGIVVRGISEQVIRIDIVGEPLFRRLLCGPINQFDPPQFVKTINGCPPDIYGSFIITATDINVEDTALRVYPENNGLRIDLLGTKTVKTG
jgi:hypothetical protein